MKEDTLVQEARYDTRHDVSELRRLYYGRSNIYVAFTDDGEHDLGGRVGRPYGLESWEVNDVVGRKYNSIKGGRYAFVFRYVPGVVLDEGSYHGPDMEEDIDLMRKMDYVNQIDLEESIQYSTFVGSSYDKLMDIIRRVTFGNNMPDRLWRRILMDLGYDTVKDRDGRVLVLDYEDRLDLDIVPYQTFKKENRYAVIQKINRKNKRMLIQRNRFAKAPKTSNVSKDDLTKVVDDIKDVIGMVRR